MTPAVQRVNRVVLTLLGLLLCGGAAIGFAWGVGAFGAARARRPVLDRAVTDYAGNTPWFWWAVAGGAALIGLLALAWLLAQGRTERVGRIDLTPGSADGSTSVHAGALTEAVEREVGALVGVTGAWARLRGTRAPRLDLIVGLDDNADLVDLRHRLERQTVTHVRQALASADFPVRIQLRPAPGGRPRVR
jgi:hypothetical protein